MEISWNFVSPEMWEPCLNVNLPHSIKNAAAPLDSRGIRIYKLFYSVVNNSQVDTCPYSSCKLLQVGGGGEGGKSLLKQQGCYCPRLWVWTLLWSFSGEVIVRLHNTPGLYVWIFPRETCEKVATMKQVQQICIFWRVGNDGCSICQLLLLGKR